MGDQAEVLFGLVLVSSAIDADAMHRQSTSSPPPAIAQCCCLTNHRDVLCGSLASFYLFMLPCYNEGQRLKLVQIHVFGGVEVVSWEKLGAGNCIAVK